NARLKSRRCTPRPGLPRFRMILTTIFRFSGSAFALRPGAEAVSRSAREERLHSKNQKLKGLEPPLCLSRRMKIIAGANALLIASRNPGPLDRSDWLAWLNLTRPESELLRPLSAGDLTVEQVR